MEDKKFLYKGFHSIEQLDAIIKGEPKVIEKLGLKSAVAAIVTDAEGKTAFVKQYRPCVDAICYEMPAGLMDKDGLTSKEILTEELWEECEIDPADIVYFSDEPIHSYYMVCSSSDAKMSLYRVKLRSIQHSKAIGDEDVDSVEWLTPEEFEQLARRGEIKDPETLIAYLYMRQAKKSV